MGQAKQKAAEISKWLSDLSDGEKTVYAAARSLFDKVIKPRNVTGMCYHSVFFLHEYLKDRHGIETKPVIGYVNDGTDDIFISHAWLDYDGKRTDVSLAVTEHPEVSPAGDLIVLDRVIKKGHTYSYHIEMTAAALKSLQTMRLQGHGAIVEHKMDEHMTMIARSRNASLIRPYLDAEPNGFTYNKIAELLEA